MKDFASLISVAAILIATVVGMALYQHTSNVKAHEPCPCVDGKCPCDPVTPRKPAPYKPRRPDGSTGEVGKIDGVTVRDM